MKTSAENVRHHRQEAQFLMVSAMCFSSKYFKNKFAYRVLNFLPLISASLPCCLIHN